MLLILLSAKYLARGTVKSYLNDNSYPPWSSKSYISFESYPYFPIKVYFN